MVKLTRAFRQRQASLLGELGLHAGQDVLVWLLAQRPDGVTVGELAKSLGVEPPTATRSLSRLESGGWFTRQTVKDRRVVQIRPTQSSLDSKDLIEAVWRELAEEVTAGLSDAQRRQFVLLMEKARNNFGPEVW
jgi:DNA-binding MarR family transcriptional regulator